MIAKSLKPSALIALLVVSALILVVGLIWFTCSRNAESEFYYNRALHLAAGADYDEAISDYTEVIRLNPNSALAYNSRARAFEAQGKHVEAQADFDKAKQLGYTGQE